jgi:4-methyl-5(b-hydroxyethyl)-thiazole monophosphate biosynthesis
MEKKVLVILADGFEEIEGVTPIDILRRAGALVTVAGLGGDLITSARGVTIHCDADLESVGEDHDALVLPGGSGGAKHLAASGKVMNLVLKMHKAGKLICAICAAPAVVLAPAGILNGKRAACYPGLRDTLDKSVLYQEDDVVIDGNLITSTAAGTSVAFALAIVGRLYGKEESEKIRSAIRA